MEAFQRRLLAVGLALVIATALWAVPGYLTWDSGTYHMMVHTLYVTGGFSIPNGYPELSSPLLAVGQTMVRDGDLVAQYPEYYTILALPFYALFGFRGFMVMNALAFVGICALVWRMARWFSDDPKAPLAALVVYGGATYALEFTQSSYPHLTSTFFICASVWLVWGAALGTERNLVGTPPWLTGVSARCALAGLLFGVGIGVRLDTLFAGMAIGVPFLVFRSLGFRHLLACGSGVLLAALGLVWINAIKFGAYLPVSYGHERGYAGSFGYYLPVGLLVVALVTVLVWHRHRPIRLERWGGAAILAAILLALVLTPHGQRLLNGIFQLVVDMRIRPDIPEAALSRSAGGAVVYHGSVKKALLESCPYLILIVIPAFRALFSGTYGTRWLLWLVPLGFISFYGYLAWHGSVGWNMRYFNPALPFLALLASHELLRLLDRLPIGRWYFWAGVAALWALLLVVFFYLHFDLAMQEVVILNGGLIIAAVLLLCQVCEQLVSGRHVATARRVFGALLVFALAWSSALTVGSDYVLGASVRFGYLRVAEEIRPHLRDRALLLTYQPNGAWALIESDAPPMIAKHNLGTVADAVTLVERAINRHPVFWQALQEDPDAFDAAVFEALRTQGIRAEMLFDVAHGRPFRLYRLHRDGTARSIDDRVEPSRRN